MGKTRSSLHVSTDFRFNYHHFLPQLSVSTAFMDWEAEYTREQASSSTLTGSDPTSSSRFKAITSIGSRAMNAMAIDDDDDDIDAPSARVSSIPTERMALDLGDGEETPLEQLTRHWLNERHSPEILEVQNELLAKLLDHVRRQVLSASLFWL